jgi:hypothetical protein
MGDFALVETNKLQAVYKDAAPLSTEERLW